MPKVLDASQEIHCKIVFYGAQSCGKSSNLTRIYERTPWVARGELLTLATETEQTAPYDFLPLDLGAVRGYRARCYLYSVPGRSLHQDMRVMLLNDVDGIVFVVDSQRSRFRENVLSLQEMERGLTTGGRSVSDVPLVLQYNKRDLPDAVPVSVLNARLNPSGVPYFPAVATSGAGVFGTLRAVSEMVVAKL